MNTLHFKLTTLIVVCLVIISLAGCTGKKESVRTPLSISEVQALSSAFEKVVTAENDAWNSHDFDAIQQIYTEDVVHFDGQPMYTGIDEVMGMARKTLQDYPEFKGRMADTFIGRADGIVVWEYWNVLGYTQAHPIVEYDLVQTREERISYWRLFYFPRFMAYLNTPVDNTLVEDYASIWSSADPTTVAALYAEDGVKEDTLFGETSTGRAAIESFAANFFAWYPGAKWTLLEPFSEQTPGIMKGGIYSIQVTDSSGNPCEVRAAVLLTPSGKEIQKENIYYNAESLIAWGWAR